MRGEPLALIKQVAEYCDTHRAKINLDSEDLFDEYLEKIRRRTNQITTTNRMSHQKAHFHYMVKLNILVYKVKKPDLSDKISPPFPSLICFPVPHLVNLVHHVIHQPCFDSESQV